MLLILFILASWRIPGNIVRMKPQLLYSSVLSLSWSIPVSFFLLLFFIFLIIYLYSFHWAMSTKRGKTLGLILWGQITLYFKCHKDIYTYIYVYIYIFEEFSCLGDCLGSEGKIIYGTWFPKNNSFLNSNVINWKYREKSKMWIGKKSIVLI